MPITPLVIDIARGSFSDGPGVRTTVFFKGCPLKCPWCHNPESQRYEKEIMLFPEMCIGCGNCKKEQPCYTLARREVGKAYSPGELALELIKDKSYFNTSGGGVTFSGGEALSFIDYLSEVAMMLKRKGVHIAIQTSGFFDYEAFDAKLMGNIDLIFYDFKIMDEKRHQTLLGQSNRVILENFKKIIASGITVIPRIPLIPNYVATEKNLEAIADFFNGHDVRACEFLYYNPGFEDKLKRLGRKMNPHLPDKSVLPDKNRQWISFFKSKYNQIASTAGSRAGLHS
jgi:pyruvate formate lyase activating enzyme